MIQSISTRRQIAIALASLLFLISNFDDALSGEHKGSKSVGWRERRHKAEAEFREAGQRFLALQERLVTLRKEISSPDRKRSIEELRKEYDSLAKQLAEASKQRQEIQKRIDWIVVKYVKDNSVVISGAASATAVLERLYIQFKGPLGPGNTKSFPPQLFYEPDGSDAGIERLLAGKAEVAVLDRPLTEKEQKALDQAFANGKKQPEQVMFFKAVLAIAVHQRCHVSGLNIEQLEKIYRAEISNWSKLGVANRRIKRIGTVYPCLSWWMFIRQVLKGERVKFPDENKPDLDHRPTCEEMDAFYAEQRSRFPGGGPFARYNKDAKVIEEVSRKRHAIGYCILMPTDKKPKGVRFIPVARNKGETPVPPTQEHILLNDYPLQQTVWFLVPPNASKAAKAFIEFACSQKAVETITQCGLHPVTEREGLLNARRMAAFKRGEGPHVSICADAEADELLRALAIERTKAVGPIQLDHKRTKGPSAIQQFLNGHGELLLVNELVTDGLQTMYGKKWQAVEQAAVQFGWRAVAIVVHPDNQIDQLMLNELLDIYSGKVQSWPEAKRSIHLYGLVRTHRVARLFETKVIGVSGKKAIMRRANTANLVETLAGDPVGIGFIDVTEFDPGQHAVKIIGIVPPQGKKSLLPTREHVPDGYPLAQPVWVYVSPEASKTARDLVKFITSRRCAKTLAAQRIVPTGKETACNSGP